MAGVLVARAFPLIFCNCRRNVTAKHFSTVVNSKEDDTSVPAHFFQFNEHFQDAEQKNIFMRDMRICQDFITPQEEQTLLAEIEPAVKRLRYESYHWDNAIQGYRETEKLHWNESNLKIIDRMKKLAFKEGAKTLRHIHVLDLKASGHIKPHVDSVKFCGDTVAGLSLLSDAVMRLRVDRFRDQFVDVLLKRRSFYIMKGIARYDYTHEILLNNEAIFYDQTIIRSRRISVICRNEPLG